MWMLSTSMFMAGIVAFFAIAFSGGADQGAQSCADGPRFMAYRTAVQSYLVANPTFSGAVPASSLSLPPGTPATGLSNYIQARQAVVYASLGSSAFECAADQRWGATVALGFAQGGRWVSPDHGDLGFSVPAYVPEGALMSVFSVN